MEGLLHLGFNIPSLIAQMVNFAILLGLLYLFAYKPILRMLDERSRRIKEGVETAEHIKEEAARAGQQVQAQLGTARKEAQAIVAQAAQLGDKMKEEARHEAQLQAESLINRARAEIRGERDDAIAELRRQFVDLAIMAAEKVVNQSLDKRAHKRLIDEVLEQGTSTKNS